MFGGVAKASGVTPMRTAAPRLVRRDSECNRKCCARSGAEGREKRMQIAEQRQPRAD